VGGEFTFEGRCHLMGRVELPLATLGRLTVDPECRFDAPGRVALDLANAELGSRLRFVPGVHMRGTLRLTGATVHGVLGLGGLRLTDPEYRCCVIAQSATGDGDVGLQDLSANGGRVTFRSATIGGSVHAAGARLHNPGSSTLSLNQAHVNGNVRLIRGFESIGAVNLNRAAIDGRLDCTGATLLSEHPECGEPVRDGARGVLRHGAQRYAVGVDVDLARRRSDRGVDVDASRRPPYD
jgi:hypothetical protein